MLDRPLEQRAQALDDLLARHARAEPSGIDLHPVAPVDERVAGDDRAMALDPEDAVVVLLPGEDLDPGGQPIACRVPVHVVGVGPAQPEQIGLPSPPAQR